jgi:hypothetical protein
MVYHNVQLFLHLRSRRSVVTTTEIFLFAKNVTPDSCEGCIDFDATLNPWARALLKMGFALSSRLSCPDPWALT